MLPLRTSTKMVELSFKKIEDIGVPPRKPRIKGANSEKEEQ